MKKFISIICVSVFLLSCGGATNRMIFGTTEKNLVKQVSIEQNCPESSIVITDKIKSLGGATYSLEVCGKRIVYKQIGSVFMKAEEADKLLNNTPSK